MPELPDVEVFKNYYLEEARGEVIREVKILDKKVLGENAGDLFAENLPGKKMGAANRRGKHLFIALNEDGWLAFHFGMTGFFSFYEAEEPKSEHPRLILDFEDGAHLAFDCQRRLGEVDLIDNLNEYIEKKGLGPDALEDNLGYDDFKRIFSNDKSMAKSGLMNQSKLAGIGNVYSDEILFQAEIYPRRKFLNLSEKELKNIYEKMKFVLEEAVNKEVKPELMPDDFLLTHREEGGVCPKCSAEIKKVGVSGRNGYYCPECQKEKPNY